MSNIHFVILKDTMILTLTIDFLLLKTVLYLSFVYMVRKAGIRRQKYLHKDLEIL